MAGSVKGLYLCSLLLGGRLDGAALEQTLLDKSLLAAWWLACSSRRSLAAVVSNQAALAAVLSSPSALPAMVASSVAMREVVTRHAALVAMIASPAALAALVASQAAMREVAADQTAMEVMTASPAAVAALVASQVAMREVAASRVAMGVMVASRDALPAMLASATAKMVVYGNDVAIDVIAASDDALAACRSASGYSVLATANAASTSPRAWPGVSGAKYLVVGLSMNSGVQGRSITVNTRRAGSRRINSHVMDAGSMTSLLAVGAVCCPCEGVFTVSSEVASTSIIYVGALRCDV